MDEKIRCLKHPLCENPKCAVKNTDAFTWWLLENVYTPDELPNVFWEDKDVCGHQDECCMGLVPMPRTESVNILTKELFHSMYT